MFFAELKVFTVQQPGVDWIALSGPFRYRFTQQGFDPDIFPQIRHHIQDADNTIHIEADAQDEGSIVRSKPKNYSLGKRLSRIAELDSEQENGSIQKESGHLSHKILSGSFDPVETEIVDD